MTRGGTREGAGRPKGSGIGGANGTHVLRVPKTISRDEILLLPELKRLLSAYRAREQQSPKSPRFEQVRKLLHEIEALGLLIDE